jgi:hypothetical protein
MLKQEDEESGGISTRRRGPSLVKEEPLLFSSPKKIGSLLLDDHFDPTILSSSVSRVVARHRVALAVTCRR